MRSDLPEIDAKVGAVALTASSSIASAERLRLHRGDYGIGATVALAILGNRVVAIFVIWSPSGRYKPLFPERPTRLGGFGVLR